MGIMMDMGHKNYFYDKRTLMHDTHFISKKRQ
jgi:hypothetical protein